MKNICVFCSASDCLDEIYFKDAKILGELLAKSNFDVVYGGSEFGLMGTVTKSAKEFGSKITGVMPERIYNLIEKKSENNCDTFIVTKGMRERKAKMDELSDATIALAGGFGTLEEIAEMIVQKHLGYNSKPIIFLNTNNFYDNLIAFFNQIIEEKFAKENAKDMYYVAKTPIDAINYLKSYTPLNQPNKLDDIYMRANK